jgi:integrase/recombinase XerD
MIKFELVIQNKNKINAKGDVAIYLRMTKDRKVKYMATGQYCKPKFWNENKGEVNANNINYKSINLNIQSFKSIRENIYNKKLTGDAKENITIDEFIELIKPKAKKVKVTSTDFYILTQCKIDNLKELGKISTAKFYNDTLNSVKLFEKSKTLDLTTINLDWLNKYEKFLKLRKCIDSGIAVRMRAIRSIYNDAIKAENITLAYYPFKAYVVSKLKGNKKIRSISEAEILAIKILDVSHDIYLQLAQNLFMFSYYAGGINFVDMMQLQTKDVFNDGNRMEYVRAKTKGEFNLKLTAPAKAIISQYTANAKVTGYVFPILTANSKTPSQIANRKHKVLTTFNKNLKEIGRLCNIDFDLTSYVARHSFATHLKQKNVPTDVISEALGHQNIKITQTYLKRFGSDITDNALDTLLQ